MVRGLPAASWLIASSAPTPSSVVRQQLADRRAPPASCRWLLPHAAMAATPLRTPRRTLLPAAACLPLACRLPAALACRWPLLLPPACHCPLRLRAREALSPPPKVDCSDNVTTDETYKYDLQQ